ncbi:MAG: IS1595 family transposase [Nitrospiraceae bacterium]|nr:IS1595 family transposase [Nitrospiraceae bacterium]
MHESPIAGRDDPKTWVEFEEGCSSDETCAVYLETRRWPAGCCCPACAVMAIPGRATRGRLICRACHPPSSVTAGTIFDRTRTSLRGWFAAAWYITSQKQGVSALGLQRVRGVNSYQTAWAMRHRFRRAMVRPDRDRLGGRVEGDEAYLALRGGAPVKRKGASPKPHPNSHVVAIAVAVAVLESHGVGRIRERRIQAPTPDALRPLVREPVAPGASVRTEGAAIDGPLPNEGFAHDAFVLLGSTLPAPAPLPGGHRVASVLKRWRRGAHHGAGDPRHVDDDLDEVTFRFHRRPSRSRGMLCYRLRQQSAATTPGTYANIRDNEHCPR